jgi:hypothetical protein
MIWSSSAFLRCAIFVAPVSGCAGGGVILRGGDRLKGLVEEETLAGLPGLSNAVNGSAGSFLGGGGAAGSADSKNEKSASAQGSTFDCAAAAIGAGGVSGRSDATVGEFAHVGGVSLLDLASSGAWKLGFDHTGTSVTVSTFPGSLDAPITTGSDSIAGCSCSAVFLLVTLADLFTGFKIPGPIGPCSTLKGTKLFALNKADVGDIALLRRTMGAACIVSGD